MVSNTQRASGTRSASDSLLRALRIKRRTLTDDIQDFDAGITLKVTCVYRPQGADAKSIPANGALYLTKGQPVAWRPLKEGGGHALLGPLVVRATVQKGYGPYPGFELDTASESVTAYIPTPNVDLVRHVMTLNGAWKVAG